jgi:DNA-binding response OmpR family regulator
MIAESLPFYPLFPRLVLAYADSYHAAMTSRFLRRLGWEVHMTTSGCEARRLTRRLVPDLVALDVNLRDESGWLTCAKLTFEHPNQAVVLVTDQVTREDRAFTRVVKARDIIARGDGARALFATLVHHDEYQTAHAS